MYEYLSVYDKASNGENITHIHYRVQTCLHFGVNACHILDTSRKHGMAPSAAETTVLQFEGALYRADLRKRACRMYIIFFRQNNDLSICMFTPK